MNPRQKSPPSAAQKISTHWTLLCLALVFKGQWAQAGEQIILDQLDAYVNTQPILHSDVIKYLKTLKLDRCLINLAAHNIFQYMSLYFNIILIPLILTILTDLTNLLKYVIVQSHQFI
jgi:hypothetical protein